MSNWPALSWQEHVWIRRDPVASRRSQQRNRGKFTAAVVPSISRLIPAINPELEQAASLNAQAMTRFDQQFSTLAEFPFSVVLLRGESATSSQIENLTVRARKLSIAALGGDVGGNAELVARNVAAMRAAVSLSENIDSAAILLMHQKLTEGSLPDAGMFRSEWVWIGGESPVTASYVAPTWEDVPMAISDLVQFLQRTDLDPTIQAAIAHAQFETIHPFTDGNGRTGRAIVSALLRARGVTQSLTVPISSGLLHDIDNYVAALTAYRQGDIVPIVECFIQASESALANSRFLATDIQRHFNNILASRRRVTEPVRKIARFCCSEQAFTAGMLESETGVAKPTGDRMVTELGSQAILREEKTKVRGQKVWSSPAMTRALDEFAERAGRRRLTT